jgi:hydroxyacylglutathione hydrolase
MIQIDALPAFTDNYLWLLQDTANRRCAVVDPGDAAPVLAWLEAHADWQLTEILVTHHHQDHVGGVAQLKQVTGAKVYGPAAENIPARDIALADNARIEVLGLELTVFEVPGHTLGHIAYYQRSEGLLFCGDTLFAAGCGRLFEGTPAQMHQSLSRFAALPDATLVYCAHEYTLSNLRFAQAVEPDNQDITQRMQDAQALRAQNIPTVPSHIGLEKRTNPFLRVDETSVKEKADERIAGASASAVGVFAALRAWKDKF